MAGESGPNRMVVGNHVTLNYRNCDDTNFNITACTKNMYTRACHLGYLRGMRTRVGLDHSSIKFGSFVANTQRLKRTRLTDNTAPIVRLSGPATHLTGLGTLTTDNPSPRGLVNIGPESLDDSPGPNIGR